MSIAEPLEHEQPDLMPMPRPFDGYVEHVARVSNTCLITVQRNRYSVPCQWAGHKVSVRLYPDPVVVIADQHVIADHRRVLGTVPPFGLEAVLVAVELVLEAGALSADHVLNVLARLRDTPIIASVETTLQLREEPRADTRRYDQLHGQGVSHV